MRWFLSFCLWVALTPILNAQTLLVQDFSGPMPPEGWSIDQHPDNWSTSVTAIAGGTAPEAMFDYYPDFTGVSRLISPPIDLTGITKVNIEFHHMVNNWTGGYSVGVATRTGPSGTWTVVWEKNIVNTQPATFVSVPVANANVNLPGFQFCFFFDGNTTGISYWYIDDVHLYVPLEHDIRAETILTGSQVASGTAFTPSVKVRNIGRHDETFPVICRISDYEDMLLHQEAVNVSSLPMDGEMTVNFTPYALPYPDGLYKATYYANLLSDLDNTNDTLSKSMDSYTHLKQQVIMEIATGTWCYYCPGASMAAEEMIANGDSVAVIECHKNDTFANPASLARIGFYHLTAYPTAVFGGNLVFEGGSHNTSMYTDYYPLYRQQMDTRSPFEVFLSGTQAGNDYSVDVTIQKYGQFTNTRTALHVALTESHIYYPWEGQDSIQYTLRRLLPGNAGTPVDLSSGSQTIHLDFQPDPAWIADNLEITAFVQDTLTKEIFSANKAWLTELATTGTGEQGMQLAAHLGKCYPNPFSASTTIPVYAEKPGRVVIGIYSMLGQKVSSLSLNMTGPGRVSLVWNGTDDGGNRLPAGLYLARMADETGAGSIDYQLLCIVR